MSVTGSAGNLHPWQRSYFRVFNSRATPCWGPSKRARLLEQGTLAGTLHALVSLAESVLQGSQQMEPTAGVLGVSLAARDMTLGVLT